MTKEEKETGVPEGEEEISGPGGKEEARENDEGDHHGPPLPALTREEVVAHAYPPNQPPPAEGPPYKLWWREPELPEEPADIPGCFVEGFSGTPILTVMIPTLNNEHDLPDVLRALKKSEEGRFRVLIIDSYSKDRTADIAREMGCHVIMDDGKTRAHAANMSLEYVYTPYMVYTDADTIPTVDWTRKILRDLMMPPEEVYEKYGIERPIDSVGGSNNSPPDDPSFAKAVDVVYGSRIMTGDTRYGLILDKPERISHNPGCNVSYRTRAALSAGGYDDFLPTAEDLVFDHKLHRQGGVMLFDPDIPMDHRRRPTMKGYYKQLWRYGQGRAIANLFYPGLRNWMHSAPGMIYRFLLLDTALLLLLGLTELISGNGMDLPSPFGLFQLTLFTGLLGLTLLLMVLYILMGLVGAHLSYSPYTRLKYTIYAPLLIFIGHIAWARGYSAGMKQGKGMLEEHGGPRYPPRKKPKRSGEKRA